jgi:hypothetical protein
MTLFDLFGTKNIIVIHTDKPSYYPGERVSGTVSLSVIEPIHVDAVFLKVRGFEDTEFYYQRSYQVRNSNNTYSTRYENVRASDSDIFYNRNYCLYSCNSILTAGNFIFPFDFTLDHHLPGSFYFQEGSSTGEVSYKVIVEVSTPGIFSLNLRHDQSFVVRELLKQPLSATETYKESDVTFLCCINKGRVTMSANIDKNAAAPGENINLHILVNNSSSQVNLKRVDFYVTRRVTLRAGGRSSDDSRNIITSTSPPVPMGTIADRNIAVTLPYGALSSTRSSLITCEYFLTVELSVPWSPNVRFTLPFQVYAPAPTDYVTVISYPPGWNPITMSAVHLTQAVPDTSAQQQPAQQQQYSQSAPAQYSQPPSPNQQYSPQPQQQYNYAAPQQQYYSLPGQYQQSQHHQYQQPSAQSPQYYYPSTQEQQAAQQHTSSPIPSASSS